MGKLGWVLAITMLAGCGRVGFDAVPRVFVDAATDAHPDGSLVGPRDAQTDRGLGVRDGGADADAGDARLDVSDANPSDVSPIGADASDTNTSDADPGMLGCSPCDPIEQCGCGGEACYLDPSATPVCSLAGGLPRGAKCSADNECQPGLGCTTYNVNPGVCEPYCQAGGCPGTSCVEIAAGTTSAPVGLCLTKCDPVSGGGCPDDLVCRVTAFVARGGGPVLAQVCAPPLGGGDHAACASTADCGAGYTCLQRECAPVCRVPDGCDVGTCVSFAAWGGVAPLFIDGVEYGICFR